MTKKHLCYVLPPIEYYSPETGGALATIAMNHARELIKRGHKVTILAPGSNAPQYDVGEVVSLDIGTRDNLNILQRGFSSKIIRPLRGFDWLYTEYYFRSLKTALLNLKTAPDVVFFFNDWQTPAFVKKIVPTAKIILRLSNEVLTNHRRPDDLLSPLDLVIACSDYIRAWILRTYRLPADKVVRVHNGINLDEFYPDPEYLNSAFLRGQGSLRVLMVGRVNASKGGDLVAQGVAQLKKEGLPVHLQLAGAVWFYGNENQGKDPYYQHLQTLLTQAEAEYLGHVPRYALGELFRQADVACAPSRWNEPFGNVPLEAMASGCALISSGRGGLSEFCTGAAQIINPDDQDDFTQALRKLATEKKFLQQQKQKSLLRAAEHSWDRIVDQLEPLLVQ